MGDRSVCDDSEKTGSPVNGGIKEKTDDQESCEIKERYADFFFFFTSWILQTGYKDEKDQLAQKTQPKEQYKMLPLNTLQNLYIPVL